MKLAKDMAKAAIYCVELGIKEGVKTGVAVSIGSLGFVGSLGILGFAASKIQKH